MSERGGAGGRPAAPSAPALPPSGFEEALLALNGLAVGGFGGWLLVAGMGLGEPEAWWRPGRRRGAVHEGLDLCWYLGAAGERRALAVGARVPAPWGGEVVAVRGDFIGASVFLAHGRPEAGRRLHSVCGHLEPAAGIAPGTHVAAGEVLGALADPAARGRSLPAHLHLTLALIPGELPPERLGWELLGDRREVLLLDPATLLARVVPS